MKGVVGLNDELSKEEFVPIFRTCLDFPVVERVDQALLKLQKTWENITIPELKKLMLDKFGSQQTDVANVIKQFGAQRLVKSPDETVAQHYFRWYQNIPEVMKPSDDDGRKELVDLLHRSMYIISLEDDFLEKALSDLKDPNPDLKKYFDEACNAESRRQSYQDISKSSTSSESKGVNISKVYHKKNWVNKSDDKTDSPSVKPKTDNNTTGDNAKRRHKGQKQRKFTDKNKQTQNTQSPNQKKFFCSNPRHQYNNSHSTIDCHYLQKDKQKNIKKVDESQNIDENDITPDSQFFWVISLYGSCQSIFACG